MKTTRTAKFGLECLLGTFIIGTVLVAVPAIADPSDATHSGKQPRVTPIGTKAPGAASHIAMIDPGPITTY